MKDKKCVVVGVSGGVAVYKALDVISRLRKKGCRNTCNND